MVRAHCRLLTGNQAKRFIQLAVNFRMPDLLPQLVAFSHRFERARPIFKAYIVALVACAYSPPAPPAAPDDSVADLDARKLVRKIKTGSTCPASFALGVHTLVDFVVKPARALSAANGAIVGIDVISTVYYDLRDARIPAFIAEMRDAHPADIAYRVLDEYLATRMRYIEQLNADGCRVLTRVPIPLSLREKLQIAARCDAGAPVNLTPLLDSLSDLRKALVVSRKLVAQKRILDAAAFV
tara:strand:+ start:9353 stop:10072 length:720 start_codon:yes stop_codon:yes gene_type:complete